MKSRNYALSGLVAAAFAVGSVGDARASNVGDLGSSQPESIFPSLPYLRLPFSSSLPQKENPSKPQPHSLLIINSVSSVALMYDDHTESGRHDVFFNSRDIGLSLEEQRELVQRSLDYIDRSSEVIQKQQDMIGKLKPLVYLSGVGAAISFYFGIRRGRRVTLASLDSKKEN